MEKKSALFRLLVITALIPLACLTLMGTAAGDGDGGNLVERGMVTITAKDEGGVMVGDTRFQVTGTTEILNHLGIRKTLKDLEIPCRAVICFEPATGRDPARLIQIDIQFVPPGKLPASGGQPS